MMEQILEVKRTPPMSSKAVKQGERLVWGVIDPK